MSTTKPKRSKKQHFRRSKDDMPEPTTLDEEMGTAPDNDAASDLSEASSPTTNKKRKRDPNVDPELEIDVSLPEPPSKKALRRAKKGKPSTTTSTNPAGIDTPPDSGDELERPTATSSANRSVHSIWIGNLPFTATKPLLRTFLTSNAANNAITDNHITRIHMPAPARAAATQARLKSLNKGFAYIDFSTPSARDAALGLSETQMGGRNVLIKDAKSYEGRPEKVKDDGSEAVATAASKARTNVRPVSKRVFVGNLGFDVTKEDLTVHYKRCGGITDIHMATFEDSGKCKGFAWVTFKEEEGAKAAVAGWVKVVEGEEGNEGEDGEDGEDEKDEFGVAEEVEDDAETEDAKDKKTAKDKKPKTRKWFVNRLQGRPLRCEFAEDPTSRYKKRFGKEKASSDDNNTSSTVLGDVSGITEARKEKRGPRKAPSEGMKPGAPSDASKRRGKGGERESTGAGGNGKLGAGLKGMAAKQETVYRTGAVVESKGKKMTFE